MKPIISIALLAFLLINSGCKKQKPDTDACAQFLSERQPDRVLLKFIDKVSGESLVSVGQILESDLSIKDLSNGAAVKSWRLMLNKPLPDLHGALEIVLPFQKASEPNYQISVKGKADVVLNFKVKEHRSDGPCAVSYSVASDYKVSSHTYKYFEYAGKSYANILIVEI